MRMKACITYRAAPRHIVGKLLSYNEVVIYFAVTRGRGGANISPPTCCSHPVAVKSAGVQFHSPATIHGPFSCPNTNAMDSSSRRLHRALTPTAEVK